MRTGGELLVECLLTQGADTIFGVPGESYLAVLDALHDVQDRLRLVPNRQEGGAAFMAEAHGKLTGRPGICFVTRGPGATNAAIGVHTAMQNSSPMILFVGQIARGHRDREAFQELDYRAVFGPMAKYATEIDDPDRIPEIVARAFATAQTGRPGPVVVALPEDMLIEKTSARPGPRIRIPRAAPQASDIAELADLLEAARRPLIVAGGTGWSAGGRARLQQFAEANRIPVLASPRCQDVIDNDSPVYVGDAGLGKLPYVVDLMREADVILGINIRFGELTTDGYTLWSVPAPGPCLIHVHPAAEELNKVFTASLPIQSSPDCMASALADLRLRGAERWAARTTRARAAFEAKMDLPAPPGGVDMRAVMRLVSELLPGDGIVTNGAGNFAIWPNKHFGYRLGQRLIAPQSGAMGYGLPAAIAAKIACPDRAVICFTGDGDFQMTCQELGTAMQAGACPVVLIVNNASYGTIRMHQERDYPGRVTFTDLENPDFAALARAYGFAGHRIERTEDFAAPFRAAMAAGGGAVFDLQVATEAITPRTTLTAIREKAQAS